MGTSKDILRDEINKKVNVINQIKAWLVSEVNSYTELQSEISNGLKQGCVVEDICDQPEIFFGRNECAEGLLEQIQKWEEGEDEDA